jgi:hypothetical protein
MKTYYSGTRGTVKYDGGQFLDVTGWELNAELQPVESTTLGDAAPTFRYARPLYSGRLNVIPANDRTRSTDVKQVSADLYRTAASPSTSTHELTLITGDNATYSVIRCNAVFSDVQYANSIDGRPTFSVGFTVSGLLLDYNWDSTLAVVIDAGTFDLTEAPLTFRYFALSLATRELDLTMQPIDLRYFKADLVTLAVTVTGNPVTFELA